MINKWLFYIGIVVIVGFLSSAFKPISPKDHQWFYMNQNEEIFYEFPSEKPADYLSLGLPFTGKYFIGFKEAIGFKESRGNYRMINTLGYLGKYQFGKETLSALGIHDSLQFLSSPKLQDKAFVALLAKNKWELKKELKKYEGKVVGGVRITESGLLAAAHLGGAGSVKKFLNSNGKARCKDAYGTTIKSYLKEFAGYETHAIEANKNARVK